MKEIQESSARIEKNIHGLTRLVQANSEQLGIANKRLDEIIQLLTPQESDPNQPTLGDLLSELIMVTREQLFLAKTTIKILTSIDTCLPPEDGIKIHPIHLKNGDRPR